MEKAEARKHHYVPAAYLGRFATPPGRQGYLFVYDAEKGTSWTAKAETQALEKDLYRVDGADPLKVEAALSSAENGLMKAIHRIERGERHLPDVSKVAWFVALQCLRSPEQLHAAKEFMESVANGMLRMVTQTRERFDAATSRIRQNVSGFGEEPMPTWEEMRDAVASGSVRMTASTGAAAGVSLSAFDAASFGLENRQNTLFVGDPLLCTSTHPVVVWGGAGLLQADSVMMAVSPRVLFVSLLGERCHRWMAAPDGLFGLFNIVLAAQSRRVFGSEENVMRPVTHLLTVRRQASGLESSAEPANLTTEE